MCANWNLQLRTSQFSHQFIRNVNSNVHVNSGYSARCCPGFSSILLWMKSYVDQFLSASHFVDAFATTDIQEAAVARFATS